METAIQMLSVAMPNCEHLEPFTEFLQEQTEYKTINRDQWMGFLRFTQQVSLWLYCGHLLLEREPVQSKQHAYPPHQLGC